MFLRVSNISKDRNWTTFSTVSMLKTATRTFTTSKWRTYETGYFGIFLDTVQYGAVSFRTVRFSRHLTITWSLWTIGNSPQQRWNYRITKFLCCMKIFTHLWGRVFWPTEIQLAYSEKYGLILSSILVLVVKPAWGGYLKILLFRKWMRKEDGFID